MPTVPDPQALSLAVKLLAKKDLLPGELRARLAAKGIEAGTIEQVLVWLAAKGALNEERSLKSRVEAMSEAGKAAKGRQVISEAVHGAVSPEDVADDEAERERILKLLRARYPGGAERAKAGRFLVSRGFEEDLIESALDRFLEEAD